MLEKDSTPRPWKTSAQDAVRFARLALKGVIAKACSTLISNEAHLCLSSYPFNTEHLLPITFLFNF
jgi:hypothetical protein